MKWINSTNKGTQGSESIQQIREHKVVNQLTNKVSLGNKSIQEIRDQKVVNQFNK